MLLLRLLLLFLVLWRMWLLLLLLLVLSHIYILLLLLLLLLLVLSFMLLLLLLLLANHFLTGLSLFPSSRFDQIETENARLRFQLQEIEAQRDKLMRTGQEFERAEERHATEIDRVKEKMQIAQIGVRSRKKPGTFTTIFNRETVFSSTTRPRRRRKPWS